MKLLRFLSLLLAIYLPNLAAVTLNDLPNVGDLSMNARILDTLDQGISNGDFDLTWRETQRDVTDGGDSVIAGYFYADRSDVSWGSSSNPEVYVKVWFAQSGVVNLNFFHVGLFEVRISSSFEARSPEIFGGRSDDSSRISVSENAWRYVRHDYCWGTGCGGNDNSNNTSGSCENLSGNDYNFCETERLLGSWELTYKIGDETFVDTVNFNGGLESQSNGSYNTVGLNQYEQPVVGGYSNINQKFLVQARGSEFTDMYSFDLVNDNYLEGCHYLVVNDSDGDLDACNPLNGARITNRRAAKTLNKTPNESLKARTLRKLNAQKRLEMAD